MIVRSHRIILGSVLTLGLTGSVSAYAADVEKAKEEGTLIWYTADTLSVAEQLAAAFYDEYGISVQVNRKVTLPLVQQFVTESDQGESPADVLTVIGLDSAAGSLKSGGYLMEYVPEGAEDLGSDYRVDDIAFSYMMISMGVLYNTTMVTEEEAELLKSYEGWLDDQLTGRLSIVAPLGGSTGGNMQMIQEREGLDFIKQLIEKQGAVVYQSNAAVGDAVAAGENAIGLNVGSNVVELAAAGAPVRFVLQDEWTFVVPAVAGISAEAQHPNAAKLFMDWLFKPETQALHASLSYWVPVIEGVEVEYPGADWLEQPKNPVTTANPAEFEDKIRESVETWRNIFGL